MNLINENLISLNTNFKTQEEVLNHIAILIVQDEKNNLSINKIEEDLLAREKEISTGMGNGLAIPHALIKGLSKPRIVVIVNQNPIEWKSIDKKPVNIFISILVPSHQSDKHLDILSKISSKLLDEKKITNFINLNKEQIVEFINSDLEEKKIIEKPSKGKLIVGVTACPLGIAHTFIAAEAIEEYGKANGYKVKIEKQASIGTSDELSREDIDKADFVIIAAGREIEGRARFKNKVGIEVGVSEAIKRTADVYKKIETDPEPIMTILNKSTETSTTKKLGQKKKQGPLSHLLVGLSYMIPFVIVGGLFLAISMGLGYEVRDGEMVPRHSFWAAMNFVGVQGFVLMVPVIAGFTANSIAGRSAIAPAMIIALLANDPTGRGFFNYGTGNFGGLENAGLGFLGAILAGYAIGYSVKLFNDKIKPPKWLAPSMPIFIIPLVFTTVWWIFYAFIAYLPLYWIAFGLEKGVSGLIDYNMLPVAALLLGAMMAFDMGGPINKIAFFFGVSTIASNPEVMGAVGAAGAVPPLGMALGILLAHKVLKVKTIDQQDKANASSAGLMGFIGITEGAIPFALKYPKVAFPANMIGGAIAALIAALFQVTNVAAHTGPLVYFLGAVGRINDVGIPVTDYVYGLTLLFAILVGTLITGLYMAIGLKYMEKKELSGKTEPNKVFLKIKKTFKKLTTKSSKEAVNFKTPEINSQHRKDYYKVVWNT